MDNYKEFMERLYDLQDMASDGGGSIFVDPEQEEKVSALLDEIVCLMS